MIFFLSSLLAFLLSLGVNAVIDTWHPIASLFGYFSLTLLHNSGIAFGVELPSIVQWSGFFLAITCILHLAYQSTSFLEHLAYGLIFGGACANIIDRLMDGVVTDYFQVGTFPIFNVADVCITVGVGVLLFASRKQ